MLDFQKQGVPTFDYGNNIRQMAKEEGVANAFDFPGFVPAYIRPLFCRGIGPFRWAALSGDPQDIYKTDAKVKELIPDDAHLHRWLDMAGERIAFQGLPGAYSHLACRNAFPAMQPLPCATFEDAFAAVREGRARYAMIPIDNSVAGRVADVLVLVSDAACTGSAIAVSATGAAVPTSCTFNADFTKLRNCAKVTGF